MTDARPAGGLRRQFAALNPAQEQMLRASMPRYISLTKRSPERITLLKDVAQRLIDATGDEGWTPNGVRVWFQNHKPQKMLDMEYTAPRNNNCYIDGVVNHKLDATFSKLSSPGKLPYGTIPAIAKKVLFIFSHSYSNWNVV